MALLDGFSIGEEPANPAPTSGEATTSQVKPSGGLLSGFSIGDDTKAVPNDTKAQTPLDVNKVTPADTSTLFQKSAGLSPLYTAPVRPQNQSFEPTAKPNNTLVVPESMDQQNLDKLNNAFLQSQGKTLTDKNQEINAQEAELKNISDKMDSYKASGNVAAYNALVEPYNTKSKAYQDNITSYNKSLDIYNKTASKTHSNLLPDAGVMNPVKPIIDQNNKLQAGKTPSAISKAFDAVTNFTSPITGISVEDTANYTSNYNTLVMLNAKAQRGTLTPDDKKEFTQVMNDISGYQFKVGLFASQVVGGGEGAEIFNAAKNNLTKDIAVHYTLPKKMYIDPDKVFDILAGKDNVGVTEKKLFGQLGLSSDEMRLARKNGITVDIPTQKVMIISDKPYWAKLKNAFGFESKDEVVSAFVNNAKPIVGPRALLEAPKGAEPTIHPTLLGETKSALESHGPDITHQTMQEKLGMSAADARAVINYIQLNRTPQEIRQSIQKSAGRTISKNESIPIKTAEEFIKEKGLDPDSISIKDNKKSIVENSAGREAKLTELPVSVFGKQKFTTLNQNTYEPGRPIKDPIEVTQLASGKYVITDGANRFTQALANGDKTIPVILEKETSSSDRYDILKNKVINKEKLTPQETKELSNLSAERANKNMPGEPEWKKEKPDESKTDIIGSSEGGYVNPAAFAQSVTDSIKNIKELIEKSQEIGEISGKIEDDIYKLEGRDMATTQRLSALIEAMRNKFTPEERENVYHYMEDSNYPLTDKEKNELLPVVKELDRALSTARAQVRTLGGYITGDILDESIPRQANVPENKLAKGFKQLAEKGKGFLPNKGTLSKSVGSGSKHRVFHQLNYDNGKKVIISTKNKRVVGFENGKLTDLGTLKTKSRSDLMKEDIKPIQNKIKKAQKLIDTLESVANPVSGKKLSNLQTKIEALKAYSKELQESKIPGIQEGISKDIVKLNIKIEKLQERLNALKPFKNVPKVAEKINELRKDIEATSQHEMNLAFSDVYEQVSELTDKKNLISEKLIKELRATTAEFKALLKVSESNFTKTRIANAQTKMVKLTNELADIENNYNPSNLNERVFIDNEGNKGTIGQATTIDIEKHTGTKYFKDPVVNYSLALKETLKAANALKFLNSLKESPEFKNIFKEETEEKPEDYIPTKLNQLRGIYGPPRIMEIFDDLAKRQTGGMYIPIYDEINNILTAVIVANPIMHFPNVEVGHLAAEAATDVVPGSTGFSRANLVKAILGVKNMDEGYLKWAEQGAPFALLRNTNQRFTEEVFKSLTKEVTKNPTQYESVSKALGYANPIEWAKAFEKMNASVTWTGNDVMLYHALLDYQSKYGGTEAEAIKAVTKRMADYRIPSRVLGMRTLSLIMQNSNAILLFMRYHYSGVIKPWVENIKDVIDPRAFENGGPTVKERLQGIRTLAFFVAAYLAYQGIDKELQKATKNPNTYMSMAGPMRLAQNVEKLSRGGSFSTFVQSIFGVSPAAKVVEGLWQNVDISNFNTPVFGPGGEGVPTLLTNNIASYSAVEDIAMGNKSWTDFALELGAGIYSPKNTVEQSNLNGMINAEKPQVEAKMKKLIAGGDTAGAIAIARDFNIRLKEAIKKADISNGNSGSDARVQYFFDTFANGLGQKGYAVRMPSQKTMDNYTAKQGKTSAQKTLPKSK